MILDPDLQLLEESIGLIDAQLEGLELASSHQIDPDQQGVFDSVEQASGLGFVACQNYISARVADSGLGKSLALQLGSRHGNGRPMVALVNAAANYWKHSIEWERAPASKHRHTADLFASLVEPRLEYPIGHFLHRLCRPQAARFQPLVSVLSEWNAALRIASS